MTTEDGPDFVSEVLRENKDLIPSPYGGPSALDQSGSVATPLLAGFALTMASLVLTSDDRFRWPDLLLLLLAVAVVSLVMSVQAAQWARTFYVHPADVEAWWPDMTTDQREARTKELRDHDTTRRRWAVCQSMTYRVGLLALLAGLSVALVPPPPDSGHEPISWVRWAAVGVALLGLALEVAWITATSLATSRSKGRVAEAARRSVMPS